MSNYREILRQNSLGISGRNIANSCSCSRNTVSKILKQAEKLGVTWEKWCKQEALVDRIS